MQSRRWFQSKGMTLVELTVAISIIGLLAGLLLPAVSRSREAARRTQCLQRLAQTGIALHLHHDAVGNLPPGWIHDPSRDSAFGWYVPLLHFSEQSALARSIDSSRPLCDAANAAATQRLLDIAICPSDIQDPLFALYEEIGSHDDGGQVSDNVLVWLAAANFMGVFGTLEPDTVPGSAGDGAFLADRAIRFTELERGLSQTLLVGERTASKLPSTWIGFAVNGEDAPSRIVGYAYLGPNRDDADEGEFSSRHPGCVNFLWGDGHAAPLSDDVDVVLYRRLAMRSNE